MHKRLTLDILDLYLILYASYFTPVACTSASSGATRSSCSTCCFRCRLRRSSTSTPTRVISPRSLPSFLPFSLARSVWAIPLSTRAIQELGASGRCGERLTSHRKQADVACRGTREPCAAVRGDLRELYNMDLKGRPYAYTPFCDSNTAMEGYRFWKQVASSSASSLLALPTACLPALPRWAAPGGVRRRRGSI